MLSSELRILTWEDARLWRDAWRRRDLSIGFTNGCFDILHIGHLSLLEYTQKHCDRLIVGINSDASVRRLKGRNRPVNGERERAALIAAMSMVDAVVIFGDDTPLKLIKMLEPDALFKGADYNMSQIVGADIVKKVYRVPLITGRSSSKVISMVKK